jgi:hypothetical protein
VVLLLAREIRDDDFWVVDEIAGMLIETAWRPEHEDDGYRLGPANNADWSEFGYQVGPFASLILHSRRCRRPYRARVVDLMTVAA